MQTYRLQPVRGFPELGSENTTKYKFKHRQPLNERFKAETFPDSYVLYFWPIPLRSASKFKLCSCSFKTILN